MRFFAFWGFIKMNILIVGNGFDLSHYLPTKYDHFMLVMKAIEKKDLNKPINDVLYSPFEHPIHLITKYFKITHALDQKSYQMNFEQLFSEFKQSRDMDFIHKTKGNYDVSSIYLTAVQIYEIQNKLKKNGWYQYFKNHVEEIKTWIDFEQKIEEVLIVLAKSIVQIEKVEMNINDQFDLLDILSKKHIDTLNFFGFSNNVGGAVKIGGRVTNIQRQAYISTKFCHGKNIDNGFSATAFLDFLQQELEDFIQVFNLYLELIVDKLSSINSISLETDGWTYPDKIFSFNYTDTYQRLHDSVNVEYLHGSHGENQNIVLGISDLDDVSLKKLKAYGFTKYHQKLFKDTDYIFLDEFKRIIEDGKKKFDADLKLMSANALNDISARFIKRGLGSNATTLDLNFMIWGHSLDISDKDYILDLFSLNDDIDRNVRVTVYYFDKTAKFSLLNNLLAILGKDKVEQWMKNKWLCFKPNPEIKFLAQESPDVDQAS